jgi:hypothetical protein
MIKRLFGSASRAQTPSQPIIVVSGLPRSGTSMMMKMLAEGGLSAVTDSVRLADEDNPNGYFEFEPVKKLSEGQDQWLDGASGKIVKVISALLEHLPAQHRYKVLFMDREIKEILASQQKMLHRRGEAPGSPDTEMETQFREHLQLTKYWLARQPNMDVLYVTTTSWWKPGAPTARGSPISSEFPWTCRMLNVPNERLYRIAVSADFGAVGAQ